MYRELVKSWRFHEIDSIVIKRQLKNAELNRLQIGIRCNPNLKNCVDGNTDLQEFYQVTFREKIYKTIEELQRDLDNWISWYNTERTYQGKMCCGRTPIKTFVDAKPIWGGEQCGSA